MDFGMKAIGSMAGSGRFVGGGIEVTVGVCVEVELTGSEGATRGTAEGLMVRERSLAGGGMMLLTGQSWRMGCSEH
jgi:hypothetical protein